MPHLQTYGINWYGDLAGLIVVAAIGVCLWHSRRAFWSTMLAFNTVSAVSSFSLLPTAFARGDTTVAWYHLFWVAVLIPVAVATHHTWTTPRTDADGTVGQQRGRALRSGEDDDVYVITNLPDQP